MMLYNMGTYPSYNPRADWERRLPWRLDSEQRIWISWDVLTSLPASWIHFCRTPSKSGFPRVRSQDFISTVW